jgi:hypothetical protein
MMFDDGVWWWWGILLCDILAEDVGFEPMWRWRVYMGTLYI